MEVFAEATYLPCSARGGHKTGEAIRNIAAQQHPGTVATHHALLAGVSGSGSAQQTEYLHIVVRHLRKRPEPRENASRYIMGRSPGFSYRFEPGY